MQVFYRLTPKESQHEDERPIHAHDKLALSRYCLESFIRGFIDIKPTVTFLLDKCPKEWRKMIEETYPFHYVLKEYDMDQEKTYVEQLRLARELPENEIVFFQEDDYVYLPRVGGLIEEAIKQLDFVNPYDHLEFYTVPEYHPEGPYKIKLVGNHHFRTCNFNTMTWGTKVSCLEATWDTLHKFGFWDKPTWDEMKKLGIDLWSPMPSLCTHLHKKYLAPTIDWGF